MIDIIFLTAGHHFKDPGATGIKFSENTLSLEFINLVTLFSKKLNPYIPIWNDDFTDNLSTVISQVKNKESKNSLWIECHFNSSEKTATGYEVIISDNASKRSRKVAEELYFIPKLIGIKNRGIKTESESHRGKLGMLNTVCPSVLLELGFINNHKKDMDLWVQNRVKVAKELAKYLNNLYYTGWDD